MPVVPLLAARTPQAVADVEIGEEFLSADRTKSVDELFIGKPAIDGGDLFGVRLPAVLRSAELLERLGVLIQRYACGRRHGCRTPATADPNSATAARSR